MIRCRTCNHVKAHHQNDEQGCWGPECLDSPTRCQEWVPGEDVAPPKRPVRRNTTRTRHDAPSTSHAAAERVLPKTGTKRYDVWRSIRFAGLEGRTDDELEDILVQSHQSISAARNTLMNDGLIQDSGLRRKTRSGHDAIVWIIAP